MSCQVLLIIFAWKRHAINFNYDYYFYLHLLPISHTARLKPLNGETEVLIALFEQSLFDSKCFCICWQGRSSSCWISPFCWIKASCVQSRWPIRHGRGTIDTVVMFLIEIPRNAIEMPLEEIGVGVVILGIDPSEVFFSF